VPFHDIGYLRLASIAAHPRGADAPALDAAHLGIEVALKAIAGVDDFDEVAPTQVSRQRRDNLRSAILPPCG
jgi:hypothetical protein